MDKIAKSKNIEKRNSRPMYKCIYLSKKIASQIQLFKKPQIPYN